MLLRTDNLDLESSLLVASFKALSEFSLVFDLNADELRYLFLLYDIIERLPESFDTFSIIDQQLFAFLLDIVLLLLFSDDKIDIRFNLSKTVDIL